MTKWIKQLKGPYTSVRDTNFYELAFFQGVPSVMMKMILRGMRRSVKEPERSHFSPFYAEEDKWKRLVSFDDSKIAYLVLANAKGDVVWQTRDPASAAKAMEFEAAIVKLRPALR